METESAQHGTERDFSSDEDGSDGFATPPEDLHGENTIQAPHEDPPTHTHNEDPLNDTVDTEGTTSERVNDREKVISMDTCTPSRNDVHVQREQSLTANDQYLANSIAHNYQLMTTVGDSCGQEGKGLGILAGNSPGNISVDQDLDDQDTSSSRLVEKIKEDSISYTERSVVEALCEEYQLMMACKRACEAETRAYQSIVFSGSGVECDHTDNTGDGSRETEHGDGHGDTTTEDTPPKDTDTPPTENTPPEDTDTLPNEDTPPKDTDTPPNEDTPPEDTDTLPNEDTPPEDTDTLPNEDTPPKDTDTPPNEDTLPNEDTPPEDTDTLPNEDTPPEDTDTLPNEDTPPEDTDTPPIKDTDSTEDIPPSEDTPPIEDTLPDTDSLPKDTDALPLEDDTQPIEDTSTLTTLPDADTPPMENIDTLPTDLVTEDTPPTEDTETQPTDDSLLSIEDTSPDTDTPLIEDTSSTENIDIPSTDINTQPTEDTPPTDDTRPIEETDTPPTEDTDTPLIEDTSSTENIDISSTDINTQPTEDTLPNDDTRPIEETDTPPTEDTDTPPTEDTSPTEDTPPIKDTSTSPTEDTLLMLSMVPSDIAASCDINNDAKPNLIITCDSETNTEATPTSDASVSTEATPTSDAGVSTEVTPMCDTCINTDTVELRDYETQTHTERRDAMTNTELNVFEILKQVHHQEKVLKMEEQLKLRTLELNEEKSNRMVNDNLVAILQKDIISLQQRHAEESTNRIRLDGEIAELKGELQHSQKEVAEKEERITELDESLTGTLLLVRKLEEQSAVMTNKGGVDYLLQAKIADGRAHEAEQRLEVLQAELLQSQAEVKRLLERLGDLSRERREMVSGQVHTQLLQISDERAEMAERKVQELEREIVHLKSTKPRPDPLAPSYLTSTHSSLYGLRPQSSFQSSYASTFGGLDYKTTLPDRIYGDSSYHGYDRTPPFSSEPTMTTMGNYGPAPIRYEELSSNAGLGYKVLPTQTNPLLSTRVKEESPPLSKDPPFSKDYISSSSSGRTTSDIPPPLTVPATTTSYTHHNVLNLPPVVTAQSTNEGNQPLPDVLNQEDKKRTSDNDDDSSDWSSSDDESGRDDVDGDPSLRPTPHMNLRSKWEWLSSQQQKPPTPPTTVPPQSGRQRPPPIAPKPKFLKQKSVPGNISESPITFDQPPVKPSLQSYRRTSGPKGRRLPSKTNLLQFSS